jgi:hypothetical protein
MLIAVMLINSASGRICAQEINEYDLKIAYLYNFCNYVRWPNNANAKEVTIGVIGDMPTDDQLKKLSSQKSGEKKVVATRIKPADLKKKPPDILFVSGNDEAAQKVTQEALKDLGNSPVLIVTELTDPAITSTIRFVWVGTSVKISVDRTDEAKRGLELNARLLRIAVTPPPVPPLPNGNPK